MTGPSEEKTTCASVPFRTIAHFYDADDQTPENDRELSDRAEESIFRTVLRVPKGVRTETCDELEIRLPESDLTPERKNAIVSATHAHFQRQAGEIDGKRQLTVRSGPGSASSG